MSKKAVCTPVFVLMLLFALGTNASADSKKQSTAVFKYRVGTTVVVRASKKKVKAPSVAPTIKRSQFATTADFVKYLLRP